MNEYNHSLLMAEVYDLKVFKNEFNKEKCNFSYKGRICRDLSVTDPEYYCYGECKMSRAYIIVSLPHKDYRGKYYKFVAKIFPQSPITVNDLSLLWTLGK